MEISIRLVLVAMVGLVTATVVIFMLTGKATGFDKFLDSQSTSSECKLLQQQGKDGSDRWKELGCGEVVESGDSPGGADACPEIPGEQDSRPCPLT